MSAVVPLVAICDVSCDINDAVCHSWQWSAVPAWEGDKDDLVSFTGEKCITSWRDKGSQVRPERSSIIFIFGGTSTFNPILLRLYAREGRRGQPPYFNRVNASSRQNYTYGRMIRLPALDVVCTTLCVRANK